MKNCLIIDDCADTTEMLTLYLLEADYAVWSAESVEEAFELLHQDNFDFILCDLHLPFTLGDAMCDYQYSEEVGIRTISELIWVYPTTPVIAMSGSPEIDIARALKRLPGIPFLRKPISRDNLQSVLSSVQTKAPAQDHLEALF